MALPVFIVYQHNYHHIRNIDNTLFIYMFTYPQCAVYGTVLDLKYLFHFISVLMTLLMCLQKTIAVSFPIWSRRCLSIKMSTLTCLFILIFSITLFSPIIKLVFYFEEVAGSCCKNSKYADYFLNTYMYIYLEVDLLTCIACAIVVVCTIYISCKLTILRSSLP